MSIGQLLIIGKLPYVNSAPLMELPSPGPSEAGYQFAEFLFCMFVIRVECYLLFHFFKEFNKDRFGCLCGLKGAITRFQVPVCCSFCFVLHFVFAGIRITAITGGGGDGRNAPGRKFWAWGPEEKFCRFQSGGGGGAKRPKKIFLQIPVVSREKIL